MKYKQVILFFLIFGFSMDMFPQNDTKPKVKCDYLLYFPKDYKISNDSFPLIIYLHGGSQRGKDLDKLKAYGLPYLIDEGHNYDFIVASPQCPDNTYWSRIDWFDSLYVDLISRYRIDKNRIYVTGISMGGFGAWQAAMDFPDKIAAIIPLAGGCNDSIDICRIKEIPIWTFHGTLDDEIFVDETDRLVKRLKMCNGNIIYTRLENVGHGIQDIYERQEIYDWLKRQNK
jgi:predicted peptidase